MASASYTQMRPLFELGLVPDAGALKRAIALKILQHALYDLAHRAYHRRDLLMRDTRAGVRCLLDDVLVLAHTAEKQPRHPGRNVSQRQVFDDAAKRSLARRQKLRCGLGDQGVAVGEQRKILPAGMQGLG